MVVWFTFKNTKGVAQMVVLVKSTIVRIGALLGGVWCFVQGVYSGVLWPTSYAPLILVIFGGLLFVVAINTPKEKNNSFKREGI